MFLWCMEQKFCEFWVSVEDTNALDYVTVIKFGSLASERDLLSNKLGEPIRKLLVDDLIEFVGT